MDELTSVFVQESRDQLTAMEAGLLELESRPDDADLINAIFRAAHTIKGAAATIECHFIVEFTHVVESALVKLRDGALQPDSDLIALLLACQDHIAALIDVLESGAEGPSAAQNTDGDALLGRLQKNYLGADGGSEKPKLVAQRLDEVHVSGGGAVGSDVWHISLRFGQGVLKNGMDPVSFLRFLTTFGQIVTIETISDSMPAASEMDPENCYLGFEIAYRSTADKSQIEMVFDFVRDECELRILPPNSRIEDFVQLIESLPEDAMRLGEILVRIGAVTQAELDNGLKHQAKAEEATPPGGVPIGSILVEQQVVQPRVVEAAAIKQKQVTEKKAAEARLIRIQADKLDRLIDLVGELVIAGASANLLASRSGQSELTEATSLMSRLVEHIRDSALQLRMVQIGETFNRFNRVVRDTSKELGKEIDLVIRGAETELDKSVVEKIGDPLMHLVRNAMDHGIETTEARIAAGKNPHGQLGLTAYHDSGSIVIEVSDDGGGLNKDKIQAKALERGVIQPGEQLSDQEIINLIFEPGFSTADKVSNISGRGVGMDVVRKNIQALRGTVEVHTRLGEGSRFTIRLPLTLAIIDGFLTSVGKASYVVPLDMVIECIELQGTSDGRDYLNLRGEVLPFIRLRQLFEITHKQPERENVVVVQFAGRKAGIVVDQLHGEFQTVIKPLGTLFRNLRGIGGSTILGSGEVALILDVQSLVNRCAKQEDARNAALARVTEQ